MNRSVKLWLLLVSLALTAAPVRGQKYTAPQSPRSTFNFNPGWKFLRKDVPQAVNPAFDDSAWTSVSLPHTWNDVDTYRA